jgi:hypothetical protein
LAPCHRYIVDRTGHTLVRGIQGVATIGTLIYGRSGITVAFDDRMLTHLQMVIGAKLRRNEGFFFSWKEDATTGTGRGSLWLSSAVPLSFAYQSSARTAINPAWLEALAVSANTPQGLVALEEPAAVEPEAEIPTPMRREPVTAHSERSHSRRNKVVGF